MLAGDTFRAAAADQLSIWADRVGVPIVKHKEGADPAAVVYDAMEAAKLVMQTLLSSILQVVYTLKLILWKNLRRWAA